MANKKQDCLQVRTRITMKLPPAFFKALTVMAAASGITHSEAAADFAAQLLEVAIVDAYRARFGTTISGHCTPEPQDPTEIEIPEEI
jgi:hypothetical protein